MSRHTHPREKRKHSRGHIRFHADRMRSKRWGQAKLRHDYHGGWHPDFQHANPNEKWESHWPFNLSDNEFTRNPFNKCSCWVCSYRPEYRRIRRAREKALWTSDWVDAASEEVLPLARMASPKPLRISEEW